MRKRKSNKHTVRGLLSLYPISYDYGIDGNYGPVNVYEHDNLLKYYVDEAFQPIGSVWNVKSDTWGAKNRQGVVRRFSGNDSKQQARSWARDSVYKTPELRGHELSKDIEVGSDHKPHDIQKSTKEDLQERNYKQEYKNYHSNPKQKKRRAQRNAARRKMTKNGRVKKGDNKDVHHRNHNTADNSSKNLAVTSKSYNRSRK